MKNLLSRFFAGFVCLTALPLVGCGLAVQEQEVLLRVDPERDQVDLVVTYEGLTHTGDSLEHAAKICQRVFEGRRELGIAGWSMHLDFDEMSQEPGIDAEARRVLESIELVGVEASQFHAHLHLVEQAGFSADGIPQFVTSYQDQR